MGDHEYDIPDFQLTPVFADAKNQQTREQLLDGYFEVPKTCWRHLIKGMQIRYQNNNETIVQPGGFISYIVRDVESNSITSLRLSTTVGYYNKANKIEYSVHLANVDKIWKHWDRFSFIELNKINGTINRIGDTLTDIIRRLDRLEAARTQSLRSSKTKSKQ